MMVHILQLTSTKKETSQYSLGMSLNIHNLCYLNNLFIAKDTRCAERTGTYVSTPRPRQHHTCSVTKLCEAKINTIKINFPSS